MSRIQKLRTYLLLAAILLNLAGGILPPCAKSREIACSGQGGCFPRGLTPAHACLKWFSLEDPTMRPQAKPRVNFFAQVSIDTDERRRRLQERTGYSVPRLIDEALRELETNLDGNLARRAPEHAS